MLEIVAEILFPTIIAFIMLTLGMGTRLRDFAIAFARPRALALGVGAQMLLLPLMTYTVVWMAGVQGEWAFGIMVLAACPGGVTTNMFTRLAGGNVALSISMTAIVTALSTVTLPLWIAFWASVFLTVSEPDINVTGLAVTLILITVVPAAIGLAWRHFRENSALSFEPRLMHISQVLFWFILLAGAVTGWDTVREGFFSLGPVLLVLALVLIGTGWAAATAAGLSAEDRITIAIETGIQNSGTGLAALAVLFTVDENFVPDALVPLGLYVLIILAMMVPLVFAYRSVMPRA
jgi:BASS family bile acid:Na+ symporter